MTDPHREQRPLLCDDYSDDEFDVKNYHSHRRKRPSLRSGRAYNYAKGAAAVITHWPDNCSTSVAYWWLGVSMIAIIVFVIYNSVLIFGMIPTVEKEPKYRIFNNEMKPKTQILPVLDVYMHIITNNSTDVLLNKYFPHVRILSKKHPSFKYKFLVLLNDTSKDYSDYKDAERNEIAFNSLWSNEKVKEKISGKYNIFVEYVSLTSYLNDSPIKKFWRHLPSHLIEFLVRPVSIWERGGIAFNPKILLPNKYNRRYVDKLYNILNKYIGSSSNADETKNTANVYADLNKRRPNNIQDIINELDADDNNISDIDLSEAENNHVDMISNTENILKIKRDVKYDYESGFENKNNLKHNYKFNDSITQLVHHEDHKISDHSNSTAVATDILPLFLKYLFNNKPNNVTNTPSVIHLQMSKNNTSVINNSINKNQNQSRLAENVTKESIKRDESSSITYSKENCDIQPDYNSSLLKMNKFDNLPILLMDVDGNIIASKRACHAFLGTMFSNVIHHAGQETLTDFIISELSLFCNGLLTSCASVNVILV